ncbi:6-pyruvoyl tetrahydrobiopterin synthase [hydrothermal vent metagenome]|uniref:6-pyruvoyl tetrahydrobiopterin synthase n=1 Tax=hydrothermal vent metagenome TaxID=652676 RepID=A0A3B0UKT9_9ZZZZ
MQVSVFRKEHFNAAHRLFNPDWEFKKNEKIFGKCNNKYYHGHNYELIVQLTGTPNPETGFVYDMKILSELIKEHILEKFDHKNLNEELDEFKTLIPTAENISIVIYNILRPLIDQQLDLKIILYETPRNYVQYPA